MEAIGAVNISNSQIYSVLLSLYTETVCDPHGRLAN